MSVAEAGLLQVGCWYCKSRGGFLGLAKEDIADEVVPGRGVPFGMAGMVTEHNFLTQ